VRDVVKRNGYPDELFEISVEMNLWYDHIEYISTDLHPRETIFFHDIHRI